MSLKSGGRNGARVIVLPLPAVASLGVVVGTLWELLLACLASITCKWSGPEIPAQSKYTYTESRGQHLTVDRGTQNAIKWKENENNDN